MNITQSLLTTSQNRPALREDGNYNIPKVRGIVIHWTGNVDKGADAYANRRYFNTTERPASAHYIVDDKVVIQCVPDNEVAWHVGDKPRGNPNSRNNIKDSRGPNYELLGIEMCVNKDGDWAVTYNNTIKLTRQLIAKYKLTTDQVYRHYDITGKSCPLMFLPDKVDGQQYDWNWLKFKDDLTVKTVEPKVIEKEVVVYRDKKVEYSSTDLFRMLMIKLGIWR